jgi:hypothetical protein
MMTYRDTVALCIPQHSIHFTTVERAQCTLNRRLHGQQSQSGYFGEEKKISLIAARKQTLDTPA